MCDWCLKIKKNVNEHVIESTKLRLCKDCEIIVARQTIYFYRHKAKMETDWSECSNKEDRLFDFVNKHWRIYD